MIHNKATEGVADKKYQR